MNLFRLTIDSSTPRSKCSLNGEWRIAPGTKKTPTAEYSRSIQVPSLVDCCNPHLNGTEADYYWYQCKVEIEGATSDKAIWLRLEQAQFSTAVWVDDKPAGESIACYTSQEYRIDRLLSSRLTHTLAIRVGARQTLPPQNAAGRDIERDYFPPGIWGDVDIVTSRTPHIKNILVIPLPEKEEAGVRVFLDAAGSDNRTVRLQIVVSEWDSGKVVSDSSFGPLPADGNTPWLESIVQIRGCHPWSPDDPFLYIAEVSVFVDGRCSDKTSVRFGMRAFTIRGQAFFLNGSRIALRGGNVAFHRFLSDSERELLPWDLAWVKRVLIDIPKAHNFNFFRMHLGHAYNRWYDLADEGGMLIQDEWPFWNATGSNRTIEQEFRQWILDNGNHPSIVIWDPLNESTDDSLVHDVVPGLRELDPTRPWEAIDFHEQHPYIYSLGMTLNMRQFGHSAGLPVLQKLREPIVMNEFLWWWFDSDWRPTILMNDVVERWLGRSYSTQDIIEHQATLAVELVELFRRMGCAAIQPFVYLSNNRGPTAHWFEGALRDLTPKPLLGALRNAYEAYGVSIELSDRHYTPEERIPLPVHVFNDRPEAGGGTLVVQVIDSGGVVQSRQSHSMNVAPTDRIVVPLNLTLPADPGSYRIHAALMDKREAVSERTVFVVRPRVGQLKAMAPLFVLDPLEEVEPFLRSQNVAFQFWENQTLPTGAKLFVNSFGLETHAYEENLNELTRFLNDGGLVIVQEPEFRTVEPKLLRVSSELSLRIERRADTERGGYDSYVFPEEPSHALWRDLRPEHFRWFNGAPGGEIVSEYLVAPSLPFTPLASCGLGLRIPAVLSIPHGRGQVIVSRIQIRGRLDRHRKTHDNYARKFDPVAAQYLFNLLSL